jgi:hypothetical protein
VALVHHPLADETGLAEQARTALFESERRALRAATRVVVTSRATAVRLGSFGVAPSSITVIEPGTAPAPASRGSGRDAVELLCVARSVRARARRADPRAGGAGRSAVASHLRWRTRPRSGVDRPVQDLIRVSGLEPRGLVRRRADAPRRRALRRAADVFVLPTWCEAMGWRWPRRWPAACRWSVRPPARLAILVARDAGRLVPPGDPEALTEALRSVIDDLALRARLSAGARRVSDAAQLGRRRGADGAPSRASMGDFTPEWLALREPADAAARSERLPQAVAARFTPETKPHCSTSAPYRRQRPLPRRTAAQQRQWLLVDHDPALLIDASQRVGPGATRVASASRATKARWTSKVKAWRSRSRPGWPMSRIRPRVRICSRPPAVTASALLDLGVGRGWVEARASAAWPAPRAVRASLRRPLPLPAEEPEDDDIRQLVNEHQRGDKGFGPALGPSASAVAAECFGARGYAVEREASDWHLEPDATELQRQMIEGWSRAAVQIAPDRSTFIREWTERRLAHVVEGHSRWSWARGPRASGSRARGCLAPAAGAVGLVGVGRGEPICVRRVAPAPPASPS